MTTAYSAKCQTCQQHCDWIPNPMGGQWAHYVRPPAVDDHRPKIDWQPMEKRNYQGDWITL